MKTIVGLFLVSLSLLFSGCASNGDGSWSANLGLLGNNVKFGYVKPSYAPCNAPNRSGIVLHNQYPGLSLQARYVRYCEPDPYDPILKKHREPFVVGAYPYRSGSVGRALRMDSEGIVARHEFLVVEVEFVDASNRVVGRWSQDIRPAGLEYWRYDLYPYLSQSLASR